MCKMYKSRWLNFLRKKVGLSKKCEHTHTFASSIENVYWYYKGEAKGKRPSLQLEGCYGCGKIRIRDTKA